MKLIQHFIIIFAISYLTCACYPQNEIPIETGTPPALEEFLQSLQQLRTYRYETRQLIYRNAISQEVYTEPHEILLQGIAEEGRILSDIQYKQRTFAKYLIVDSIVYEPRTSLEGLTWGYAFIPSMPNDIGQPFLLRELLSLGGNIQFLNQDDNGILLFIATVQQQTMEKWTLKQLEINLDTLANADSRFQESAQQAFHKMYSYFITDQEILVRLTPEGRLLETDATLRQIIGNQNLDLARYITKYYEINNPAIQVPLPED
ncbi:MAG: hypothetical protein AB1345_00565 [Chloroflexota bacterium]